MNFWEAVSEWAVALAAIAAIALGIWALSFVDDALRAWQSPHEKNQEFFDNNPDAPYGCGLSQTVCNN